mmetsp:Transcript_22212/g.61835  ORF Transcript_22212/g.61835 Transcript_22212/m.61835 type:complete len:1475 (-) Transcript_22212:116-4540(-)
MEGGLGDVAAGNAVTRGVETTARAQARRTAAIDVLTRALKSPPHVVSEDVDGTKRTSTSGDVSASSREEAAAVAAAASAARSFLDQTCSVYVLDADTSSTSSSAAGASGSLASGESSNIPKIFGCWNFLHQAMNEIERFEDEQRQQLAQQATIHTPPIQLLSETRLLAEFAVKVARRSDDLDRRKVATCLENFCSSHSSISSVSDASSSNSGGSFVNRQPQERSGATGNNDTRNIGVLLPELVRANAEIREIVAGRIAAFSFHNNHRNNTTLGTTGASYTSALEDPRVVETFCKFLAANAVSNGTERLRRFLNDWIIPGATAGEGGIGENPGAVGASNPQTNSVGNKRQRVSHDRLPPYSLACVLYHVASESSTATPSSTTAAWNDADATTSACAASPTGTIDVLQRLSLPVMGNVLLGPVLHDGLQKARLQRQLREHRRQSQPGMHSDDAEDNDGDAIVAMGLRAISAWCSATDLSLAQTKHIGSKVRLNLSHLLGEALNMESPKVMIALADLIENVVERHVVPRPRSESQSQPQLISEARMTQTRYLMQVPDEKSFRANVSEEQLHAIETKELSDILRELAADVERQRFQFPSFGRTQKTDAAPGTQRPSSPQGDVLFDDRTHSLGHSLARIAAAVCRGCAKVLQGDAASRIPDVVASPYQIPGNAFLELLSKCASHPSVAICGIILPVITPLLKTEVGLATEWLPTLQRRAIIPHHPKSAIVLSSSTNSSGEGNEGTYIPLLNASDVCFVEFEEFIDGFRDAVLADALNACYGVHSEYYLASCTAAIEEFCVGDVATEQTSFHLEAALFCLAVVAEQVLPSVLLGSKATVGSSSGNAGSKGTSNASSYLLRCTAALAKKPKSLSNPLTMAQACQFLRKYVKWFGSNQHPGVLDIAADLTLFILSQCATVFPDSALSKTIRKETGVTPYSKAAETLRCLLSNNAKHFLSNKAIAALGAGWESTFAACNRGDKLLTLEDRKNTCIGICHVLAALPKEQQRTSLMALALASIACLETMTKRADAMMSINEKTILPLVLDRAADEIVVLATTARAFTDAASTAPLGVGNGRISLAEPSMVVLRRAWPTISILASRFSFHDSILDSLSFLFHECTPSREKSGASTAFLQEICALAKAVVDNSNTRQNKHFFSPVFNFADGLIQIHANAFQTITQSIQAGIQDNQNAAPNYSENEKQIYQSLNLLLRETITVMGDQNLLGRSWARVQKQGIGQSAFESKTKLEYTNRDTSNVGLGPLFSLLRTCARLCPTFFFHVLDGAPDETEGSYPDGSSSSDNPMLRRVLDSAVSCIIDSQSELSIRAIAFLESYATLTSSFRNRKLTEEYTLRLNTNVLGTLLRGMCGIFQPAVVPDACRLFWQALSTSNLSREESKVLFVRGLGQEHFFLGEKAWGVIYEFCLQRTNHRTVSAAAASMKEMETMMTDLWQLHRFENIDAIERSDDVHAFCIRHGSKKRKASS